MVAKLLKNQSIAFLVFVLIVVALFFLFFPTTFEPSKKATLDNALACNTQRLDPDLLALTVEEARRLKLLISMHAKPDEGTVADFASKRVTLYPESWIFDYLVAEADFDSLCFLAEDSRVSYVDLTSGL